MKLIAFNLLLTLLFLSSGCTSNGKKTTAAAERDGSSFAKAIIVKSVKEEYDYVRKVCPACQMRRQHVQSRGRKYYDLLYFDNAGFEVVYYFDINSFYGKMF